jgi:hypothetical protein
MWSILDHIMEYTRLDSDEIWFELDEQLRCLEWMLDIGSSTFADLHTMSLTSKYICAPYGLLYQFFFVLAKISHHRRDDLIREAI